MPKHLSNPELVKIQCPSCLQGSQLRWFGCKNCREMLWGYFARNNFYFWGRRYSHKLMRLEYLRRVWNIVIEIFLIVFVILSFVFAGFIAFKFPSKFYSSFDFWFNTPRLTIWISIGLLLLLYLVARFMRSRRVEEPIKLHKYGEDEDVAKTSLGWSDVKNMKSNNRISIEKSYSSDSLDAVDKTFFLARGLGASEISTKHLFLALVEFPIIESIFIRLGIFKDIIKNNIVQIIRQTQAPKQDFIPFSNDLKEVVLQAYEAAYQSREEEVGLGDLLVTVVRQDKDIQEVLYSLGVEAEKINNVVSWVRVHELLRQMWKRRHKAAMQLPRGETNRAMTALATPYLNQFSIDLTKENLRGVISPTIGREKEFENVFRVIDGGGKSVILVGNPGVGKTALIYGISELMLEGAVPDVLKDKRLIQLSIPALLAGGSATVAMERLIMIFNEVAKSGNIVLAVESIEDIVGVSAGGEQSLDVSEALAQELQHDYFFTIATTTPEAYQKHVANTALANVMQKVDVPEMTIDETVRVLEAKVGAIEYKNKVWFSYKALEAAARLSGRYMNDQYLPAPAIEVLQEAANLARKTKGRDALVSDQDVAAIISSKTTIPVTAVTEDESKKLLRLEDEMHKRMIGQNEAVESVANALRRARTELRSDKRPISNFLFLGPTGVGKTELAKTIAEIYFGSEDNMTRLDMSEYQDISAIDRLIGVAGKQGTGVLTEAIRKKPFSLLLLDELEKANKDVINIFLQVMDDGRLTDSVGHTVDFTNVILIATSNAGTKFVQDELAKGTSRENILDMLLKDQLLVYFRPEFLNRFDGIILFKPLGVEELEHIARLMLNKIAAKLDERGISIKFTDAIIKEFAKAGYDPQFGARSLRRVIEGRVENKLASLILDGTIKRNMQVVYDESDKITFEGV